jgi:hypothetical protein
VPVEAFGGDAYGVRCRDIPNPEKQFLSTQGHFHIHTKAIAQALGENVDVCRMKNC